MLESILHLVLTSMFLQLRLGSESLVQPDYYQQSLLPESELRVNYTIKPRKIVNPYAVDVVVTAASALVVDKDSGKILYQKNSDEQRSIASITKLMTALVFIDNNPGWEKAFTVSEIDYRPGGIVHLIAGESLTVEDIFYAALVSSANEAAMALARSTGMSEEEFVAAMNHKAQDLGMSNTVFTDVTGLHNSNKSTAHDLVILLEAVFKHQEIVKALSTKNYQLSIINKNISRSITSTDLVLGQNFGIDGEVYQIKAGKTGYLEASGYCFASQITNQNNNSIYAVVLGSSSINNRFIDTKALAYWVFTNYRWF